MGEFNIVGIAKQTDSVKMLQIIPANYVIILPLLVNCAFSQPPGIKLHCQSVRLNKSTLKYVTIATFR